MSEDNKPNTESTPSSYDLLIEKIDSMEKIIAEQNKKIEDVTKMNRSLLNGKFETTPDKTVDKKELEEKLYKGLKR